MPMSPSSRRRTGHAAGAGRLAAVPVPRPGRSSLPIGLGLSLLLMAASTRIAGAAPASRPSGPEAPAAPAAWIALDGFEDPGWPDPNLWQLEGREAPTWWPSTCRSKSGTRALWAFGGRVGALEQPCGAGAPAGTRATIYQRLDLRGAAGASRLDLYFDLWLQMPPGEDSGLFVFLHRPLEDGSTDRVPIFGATGIGGRWAFPSRKLDLMNLTDIRAPAEVYDLRGGLWRLEWVGLASRGSAPGAGLYIDDLSLVWEPDAAVTPPTPRPTSLPPTPRPTDTSTPRPSATPRPATPTASATLAPTASLTPVSFGRTYLPFLVAFWPPPPSPTNSPTPDETATAAAGTPPATATEGPSPTPTASETPLPPEPGPPIRFTPTVAPTP